MNDANTKRTYRRADGELIFGAYGWVADLEYFDDLDEPLEVIEENWALTSRRSWWLGPPIVCGECGEDREHLATGETCCEAMG